MSAILKGKCNINNTKTESEIYVACSFLFRADMSVAIPLLNGDMKSTLF